MALSKSFYERSTRQIARELLGCLLVHDSPAGLSVGRIVETEAYLQKDDPACHASRGLTKRTAPLFGPPGHSYIYFIYGMYDVFNVVTAPTGIGEGVLIRALEPYDGIELMQKRRGTEKLRELTSGPAKLVLALGLNRKQHNALDLRTSAVQIHAPGRSFKQKSSKIITTTRIGINVGAELPLRYYIDGNPFVSVVERAPSASVKN